MFVYVGIGGVGIGWFCLDVVAGIMAGGVESGSGSMNVVAGTVNGGQVYKVEYIVPGS